MHATPEPAPHGCRAPKHDATLASPALGEGPADVSGLLCGPHHLGDETRRRLGTATATADAAWAHMEVVVPRVHGLKPETETVDGGRRVEFFAEDASTAIRPLGADGRKPQSSQPYAPTSPAGLFPCRPVVGFRCRLPPLRQPDP